MIDSKERDAKVLILLHGVANILLGISFLLWATYSAENVLSRFFPPTLWPSVWAVAGVCGVLGLWSRALAQFSFVLAGFVMGVSAVASAWSVIVEGRLAAVPTTVFFVYLCGLLAGVATLIRQREDVKQQITALTQKGKSVLDRVRDGSDTR